MDVKINTSIWIECKILLQNFKLLCWSRDILEEGLADLRCIVCTEKKKKKP